MKPISIKFLRAQVERLNRITGSPLTPWTMTDGKLVANIGNYHLSGAYGGHCLHKMQTDGGGVCDVFRCGHISKRDLSNQISAYIAGIESTKGVL